MRNPVVRIVLSEYDNICPKRNLIEIYRAKPKAEVFVSILFIVFGAVYFIALACANVCAILVSFSCLTVLGVSLICFTRKNQGVGNYSKLKKSRIQLLRRILKDNNLYNMGSIEYLMDEIEQELSRAKEFERYFRFVKLPLHIVMEYFVVAGLLFALARVGIVSLEKTEFSVQGIFNILWEDFFENPKQGLLIGVFLIVIILLVSVLEYVVSCLCEDISSREKKRLQKVYNDLKYLMICYCDDMLKKVKVRKSNAKKQHKF